VLKSLPPHFFPEEKKNPDEKREEVKAFPKNEWRRENEYFYWGDVCGEAGEK
jgi:hypothetical protein